MNNIFGLIVNVMIDLSKKQMPSYQKKQKVIEIVLNEIQDENVKKFVREILSETIDLIFELSKNGFQFGGISKICCFKK